MVQKHSGTGRDANRQALFFLCMDTAAHAPRSSDRPRRIGR